MRRQEFEVRDRKAIVEVLDRAAWGTLGLVDASLRPVLVPLNHVHVDGRLYFHASPVGEKIDVIRQSDHASFLVVEPLAHVPSYVLDPVRACGATQFYRSVIVKGRVRLVDAPAEKAAALGALMRKLQPEGGYEPIEPEHPLYRASLNGIAVIALDVEEMTAKFKVGQNLSAEKRTRIRDTLADRGAAADGPTLEAMARWPGPEGPS